MRTDVAILGARMHYAVPRILAQADLLGTFYTDSYIGNKPHLRRLLRQLPERYTPSLIRTLLGRDAPGLSAGRIVSFDALGLKAAWSRRRNSSPGGLLRLQAETNRLFCEQIVKVGFSDADAVYALNGASLEVFREARMRGMLCMLEQTVAPMRILDHLLAEEVERWPGCQPGADDGCNLNPLVEREEAEWPLADWIVCGSEFVATGLGSLGLERAKCPVVPYGVDTTTFRPRAGRGATPELKVLFVGAVGLRKGVPYLLEALRKLDSARICCRLVGAVEVDQRWLAEHVGSAEVRGQIPRREIMAMYDWADVFVLPSICEGSATVTYEALSCGLPVITTPNSGSVVRDGTDGFVVPIRDPEAIARCLHQLLEDRELLRTMSEKAHQRGLEFGLERYAERLVRLIPSLISMKKDSRRGPLLNCPTA